MKIGLLFYVAAIAIVIVGSMLAPPDLAKIVATETGYPEYSPLAKIFTLVVILFTGCCVVGGIYISKHLAEFEKIKDNWPTCITTVCLLCLGLAFCLYVAIKNEGQVMELYAWFAYMCVLFSVVGGLIGLFVGSKPTLEVTPHRT